MHKQQSEVIYLIALSIYLLWGVGKSPQIANPQILGLIPLSQMSESKFIIRIYLQILHNSVSIQSLKSSFSMILKMYKFEYFKCYIVRRKSKYLRTCGNFKSANHKEIRSVNAVSHLRMVRKSNKLFKTANLRICDLRNLLADRPPL
jgi:hypothetical protein